MAPLLKIGNPVTNLEYQSFYCHWAHPSHQHKPVTFVTFSDALAYAAWFSQKTGRRYRLPTEGERQAAERTFQGDFSSHPLGEPPDVGEVGRNDVGVLDLWGNTYDWCADPEDIADPDRLGWTGKGAPYTKPRGGFPPVFVMGSRAYRGGSWRFRYSGEKPPQDIRRLSPNAEPYFRRDHLGFRLVEVTE